MLVQIVSNIAIGEHAIFVTCFTQEEEMYNGKAYERF
jgi:hypothetical protein